jgi:hypothetical protein
MVLDYANGKIYKITGNGHTYYGSSAQLDLKTRLAQHKNNYDYYMTWNDMKFITSFRCFENNNTDYKITLVESWPCNTKAELLVRERYYIELNRDECVNKCLPGRTTKEYKDNNKDKIKEQNKLYRNANKEKIKEQNKQYRNVNKDKINEIITCECGMEHTRSNITNHKRSNTHLYFMSRQIEDEIN